MNCNDWNQIRVASHSHSLNASESFGAKVFPRTSLVGRIASDTDTHGWLPYRTRFPSKPKLYLLHEGDGETAHSSAAYYFIFCVLSSVWNKQTHGHRILQVFPLFASLSHSPALTRPLIRATNWIRLKRFRFFFGICERRMWNALGAVSGARQRPACR